MSALRRAWRGLVRFGFRLLYNEFAWTYDLVSRVVSLGQWHTWQQTALPYLNVGPGARVLELAHGTGELQADLHNRAMFAVGVDLSPNMGRVARRKLVRRGLPARLTRANAAWLPFASQSFDAVASTFPTDFILRPAVLREANRVLIPGGRLVIVFNGILTLKTAPAQALEWLYHVTGQRGPWPGDPSQAFHEAGFEAEVRTEELPRSVVLLVVATKTRGV